MSSKRRVVSLLLLLFSTLYSQEIYFPKAKVTYDFFEQKKSYYSNDIKFQVATIEPPTAQFYTYNRSGNVFLLKLPKYKKTDKFLYMKKPLVRREEMELDAVKVKETKYLLNYDALFIEIVDKSSKDYVDILLQSKDDKEMIRLFEVEQSSGVFRGYIQPTNYLSRAYDGMLHLNRGDSITLSLDSRLKRYIRVSSRIRSLTSYANQDIWLESKTSSESLGSGEFLKSIIIVENRSTNTINSTFKIELDSLLNLKKSSIKVDDGFVQYIKNHKDISFELSIPANSKKTISYITKVGIVDEQKELTQKIKFAKNLLEIKTKVYDELHKSSSIIVGKVSMGTKGVEGIKLYLEDGTSTITDKNGRYHFEGVSPDIHVVKVEPNTIEERFAITSCEQNILRGGSKTTQFVDTSISNIARANFCLKYIGKKSSTKSKKSIKKPLQRKMPKYTKASFKIKSNKILWPPKEYIPSFPSLKMAFMHKSDLKYKVYVNSKEVDKLAFDGFEISKEKDFKIEKYRGISIGDGDNLLEIKLFKDDTLVDTLTENIHFSTSPVRAEVIKKLSKLEARANKSAVLAIRLYDKDGYPVREGLKGKCSINEPYYFYHDIKKMKSSPLSLSNSSDYTVESDGITYIKLNPTSESGEVKLHFDFMEDGEFLTTWLKPAQKGWIVVGFAKGSLGYKTIKDNLKKTSQKERFKEGKVSFFAKGKISSDTLLTIAYNSAKKVDLTKLENSSLKKSYFVYADDSKQLDEAPSSKKLYLKLERDNFYALFGDFNAGLNETKLAKYDTKINGYKTKYEGNSLSVTAFATNSKTIHKMDELEPDGTSGKYYIKDKNILENSETIKIVTRDRYDYDRVIKEEILTRDIDYNIEYQDGYIFFKESQFATDENLNKRYIVINYEVSSTSNKKNLTYGTHISAKPIKDIKIGTTYIKSDRGLKSSELKGIDVMMKLYKDVDIKLESATSNEDKKEAKANYQEIKYHKKNLTVKAYHDYKDKSFGIENQENIRDKDSDITGVIAKYDLTKKDQLLLKSDKKRVISTKNVEKRDTITYSHRDKSYAVATSYKEIKRDNQKDKKAIFTLRKNFFNSKIVAQYTRVKSLGKSIFEPDETIMKVNYLLSSKIKLFTQRRVALLKDEKSRYTSSGITASFWKGSTLSSSLTKEEESDSFSTFANYGVLQRVVFSKNLNLTAGYDEKRSFKGSSKLDDYKSYSGTVSYTKDKWRYNLKAEYKDAKSDKINSSASAYAKLNQNYAVAVGVRGSKIFSKDESSEMVSTVSVAYRPRKSDTIVVDRLDIKSQKSKDKKIKKVINNLYADTKLSKKVTFSGQFGVKYLQNAIDDRDYTNLIGLLGASARYDVNKKFAISSQVSMSFSLDDKTYEYSAGSSVGYSPFRDSLISLGYNIKGFNDEDFDSDIYRNSGAFVNFMLKFDEFSLNERAKRAIE